MRPKERRDTGQTDLLRSRLDAIIDMDHPLVKLSRTIDWSFLEQQFGAVYTDGPGQPPLPTRLMAGLAILKHTYDPSDEVLCERWVENPYYQFFCGEEFFQHRLSSPNRCAIQHEIRKLHGRLSTFLAVGTELGAGSDTNSNDSAILQALRHGASDSLNQTGQQVVRRSLNIQPTLTIRPGFPVRAIVNRDLRLEPYTG